MKYRVIFQAALALGAALALVGGAALGLLHIVDPDIVFLPRLEAAYRHFMFGFLFLTAFAVAAALLESVELRRRELPSPPPLPPEPAPAAPVKEVAPAPPARPELQRLYHEMKTYVDLEMWELALEKANLIVKEHPGTREAELVSKNLGELRWKAEPKFLAQKEPLSAVQERELRAKGLAQMYQHVKTYMDLEMWELARQKTLAILKNFPDTPEANELAKVYETIDRKARATATEKN